MRKRNPRMCGCCDSADARALRSAHARVPHAFLILLQLLIYAVLYTNLRVVGPIALFFNARVDARTRCLIAKRRENVIGRRQDASNYVILQSHAELRNKFFLKIFLWYGSYGILYYFCFRVILQFLFQTNWNWWKIKLRMIRILPLVIETIFLKTV